MCCCAQNAKTWPQVSAAEDRVNDTHGVTHDSFSKRSYLLDSLSSKQSFSSAEPNIQIALAVCSIGASHSYHTCGPTKWGERGELESQRVTAAVLSKHAPSLTDSPSKQRKTENTIPSAFAPIRFQNGVDPRSICLPRKGEDTILSALRRHNAFQACTSPARFPVHCLAFART